MHKGQLKVTVAMQNGQDETERRQATCETEGQ